MHSYGQSEWTPEAYRLREEARLAVERQKEISLSIDPRLTNTQPILTSDWTLEAFKKREYQRRYSEKLTHRDQKKEINKNNFRIDDKQKDSNIISERDWSLNAPVSKDNKQENVTSQTLQEKLKSERLIQLIPNSTEEQQHKLFDKKNNDKVQLPNEIETLSTPGYEPSPPLFGNTPTNETEQVFISLPSIDSDKYGSYDINYTDINEDKSDHSHAEAGQEVDLNPNNQSYIIEAIKLSNQEILKELDHIKGAFEQKTENLDKKNQVTDASFHKWVRLFYVLVPIIIFIFLLVAISHFALPLALKNTYPHISMTLNNNSSAFLSELNNYVIALIQKIKSETAKKDSSSTDPTGVESKSDYIRTITLPEDFSKVVAQSRRVLERDPLNAEHYRLLGQLYETLDDNQVAYELMMNASNLSSKEIIAHDYIFRTNLINGNTDLALSYANRLFSIYPEAMPHYAASFRLIIKNKESRDSLAQILGSNPHWRINLFSQIVPKLIESSSVEIAELITALNKSAAPVTIDELKYYITSLISAGKYHLAYEMWQSFTPAIHIDKNALLNNGRFDWDPTGLPFDWTLGEGKEARVQFSAGEGASDHVLNIEFGNGRVTFPNISQLMVLGPGNYRIEGKYKGEVLGKRGLFWIASCYRGKLIGQSEEIRGKFPNWRKFQFDIIIPDENCAAQGLTLLHGYRSQSEKILSGSISFDDINVSKKSNNN